MSTIDPDEVPGDYTSAPPEILAILGQPDPMISGPVPPNVDQRLTAQEVTSADLQRRLAELETS